MRNDLWVGRLEGFGDVIFDPTVQEANEQEVVLFDTQLNVFCRWDKRAARQIARTIVDKSRVERLIEAYLQFRSRSQEQPASSPGLITEPDNASSGEKNRQASDHTVELDGKTYVWEGEGWYDYPGFIKAADLIADKLNELFEESFLEEDLSIDSIPALLHRASIAREARQFKRSEKIASRILELSPRDERALAMLCASLRARGRPREALERTTVPMGCKDTALLTSRAAAYCDIEEWTRAKQEIARSLAIEKSDHALAVVQRIKSARPDLYQ